MAFNGSRDLTVHGGAQNVVHGNQSNSVNYFGSSDDILRYLAQHAAVNATPAAEERYPPPNCHPKTRTTALKRLGEWIRNRKKLTRVFWVHGSAGVGKSAIAQKLSEDYPGYLVGSFFFSRNDATRDKLDPVVATIAYQCCTSATLKDMVGPFIIDAIRADPTIFRSSSEHQFQKLLLEPFSRLARIRRRKCPDLIIVDGLDECIDLASQLRLLKMIAAAILSSKRSLNESYGFWRRLFPSPRSSAPFPFRFVICSRPEPQIRGAIDNAVSSGLRLERMPISDITIRFAGHLSDSDLDIQRYLWDQFAHLRQKYRTALSNEGPTWPGKSAVNNLIWRASGQFIFAVTVIKYIDTDDDRPQDRLNMILNTEPGRIADSPYPDLDLLYQQILSNCRQWDRVHLILRLLVTPHPKNVPRYQLSPVTITALLMLREGELYTLLSRLHSVLHVPDNHISEVQILHASFTEFLLESRRSGAYYTLPYSPSEFCDITAQLLLYKLSLFTTFYPLTSSSAQPFGAKSIAWQNKIRSMDWLDQFAIEHWITYCVEVDSPSASLIAALEHFNPYAIGSIQPEMQDVQEWAGYCLVRWNKCLKWAKSLDMARASPQSFIETLDSFCRGCYVAFELGTHPQIAIWKTFELECTLSSLDNDIRQLSFSHFITNTFWSQPLRFETPCMPLLCPTNATLSEGCVAARITQRGGNKTKTLYEKYIFLDSYTQRVFSNDIQCNTSFSMKKKDLDHFRTLFHERQVLFSVFGDDDVPPRSIVERTAAREPVYFRIGTTG